jgi:hypothetical protein
MHSRTRPAAENEISNRASPGDLADLTVFALMSALVVAIAMLLATAINAA